MKTILFCLSLLMIGCIGGCADPQSYVFTKLITPDIPPECLALDPKWKDPPDADVKSDETARLTRVNKDSFARMRHDRAICRAGLQPSNPKG